MLKKKVVGEKRTGAQDLMKISYVALWDKLNKEDRNIKEIEVFFISLIYSFLNSFIQYGDRYE